MSSPAPPTIFATPSSRESSKWRIIHLQRADEYGNAHCWGNLGLTREACLASRHIIITADLMGLLQQGLVDVSFIGGAQVDRFGNLNTSYIGGVENLQTRLPGSGGACDLASLARRHIIIMTHQKRRFVPRVDYITSPGYGDGTGWRERVGLPRGGPSTVITTLGVLHFDAETREMVLASIHPGVAVEEIRANTGWELRVAPNLAQTPAPTEAELAMLQRFDPTGFWTGNFF